MVTTASINEFLEGLDFPASREEFLKYAEDRNAPLDLIQVLQEIPEGTYYSMASVWEAIGESE